MLNKCAMGVEISLAIPQEEDNNFLEQLKVNEISTCDFNSLEFDGITNQTGLNRFTLFDRQWVENARFNEYFRKAGSH